MAGRTRRGTVLACLALMSLLVATHPNADFFDAGENMFVPHLLIPLGIRQALWAGCGVIGLAGAFYWKRDSRLVNHGFAAVVLMPAERAVSWTIAWLIAIVPFGPESAAHPGALISVAFWWLLVAIEYTVAGVDEHARWRHPENARH